MALSCPVGMNAQTRPCSLGCQMLGVPWVGALPGSHLAFARVWGWFSNSFLDLAWGGGVFMPSQKNFMSARKMCIRSHKNGIGILTYYRGGVLVGVGT